MYCKVCGAVIEDPQAEYCSNCGNNLRENGLMDQGNYTDQTQNIPPQNQSQPPYPPFVGMQPNNFNQPQAAPQPQMPLEQPSYKKTSSGAKWGIIIGIIAAVLLIVGIGLFLYFHQAKANAVEKFKTRVMGFEGIRSQYELGKFEEEYDSVLDRCNECIAEKNVTVIDVLEEQMEDVKNHVIDSNKEEIAKCKEEIQTLQDKYIKENEKLQAENSIKKADALLAEQKYKDAYELYEKALDELKEKKEEEKDTGDVVVEGGNDEVPVWKDTGVYYFWDSDTRYLTSYDLQGLTKQELRLARNEIYARHGRRFDSKDIQSYFDSCSWYRGTIEPKDFNDNVLSKVETANIKKIQQREKELDGKTEKSKNIEKVDGFYIYDSNTRYLTKEELSAFTAKELRIARNEIYARHGRKFTSKDLQQYFDGCSWYDGYIEAKDFDDDRILSDIEKANVKTIQEMEKKLK